MSRSLPPSKTRFQFRDVLLLVSFLPVELSTSPCLLPLFTGKAELEFVDRDGFRADSVADYTLLKDD